MDEFLNNFRHRPGTESKFKQPEARRQLGDHPNLNTMTAAHSHFIRTLACAALLLPVAPAAARRILKGAECVDSTTWTIKGDTKTCAWLSRKPEKCHSKDVSKEVGYEACPKACGLCDDGGEDSTSWYAGDTPSRDCEYVAKKRDERCWRTDDAKIEAWYACPQACGKHTGDTCLEDFADEIEDAISGGGDGVSDERLGRRHRGRGRMLFGDRARLGMRLVLRRVCDGHSQQ